MPLDSFKIMQGMNIIAPGETSVQPTAPAVNHFDRIIIIAVESLDYAFIGRTNPAMPAGITPNLDRFSEKYPSMTNYFTASQPTSWGLNSMLTSRLDYEIDRNSKIPSLFSILRRQGYFSCYFSAASGFFGDNRRFYLHLFDPDQIFFMEEWRKNHMFPVENNWGLSDKALFQGVLLELKNIRQERFIAVISTMDTHNPYFSRDISDAEKEKFPTAFLQALHNTDREIGNFVDAVTNDESLFNDRTLIIITADHSATHGENYLNRGNFLPDRIPLIFICKDKSIFKNLNTGKFASSIDLPPTILKLTGSNEQPDSFMGRDLFSDKNIAVSRLFGNKLLITNSENQQITMLNENQPDPVNKAWVDFYSSFYGK
jgi:phosphoglycerol transferase MdoB-like AlkP superfamily enzyme